MFTIHEKRVRRARKAKAHLRALKEHRERKYALPSPKTFTMRPGDHTPKPKRSFWAEVVSFFKGGRA